VKYLCAIVAICLSLVIGFGSIAELMGAPSDPPPLMFTVDKLLALVCLICSIATFWKPKPATVAIWYVTIVYALLSWKLDSPGQLIRGVFRFVVIVAICISVAAATEDRKLLPD
jgi:hypothetical protein